MPRTLLSGDSLPGTSPTPLLTTLFSSSGKLPNMHTYTHFQFKTLKRSEGINPLTIWTVLFPDSLALVCVAVYAPRERPTQGCCPAWDTDPNVEFWCRAGAAHIQYWAGGGRGGPTPDVPSCFLWPRQGRRLLAWYLLGVALGRSLRAFLPHKLLAGLGCGATEMKG